jgi:hypothetical protein
MSEKFCGDCDYFNSDYAIDKCIKKGEVSVEAAFVSACEHFRERGTRLLRSEIILAAVEEFFYYKIELCLWNEEKIIEFCDNLMGFFAGEEMLRLPIHASVLDVLVCSCQEGTETGDNQDAEFHA